MSDSMFRIYRGLELDDAAQFLTGSGVPGTGGDTDAAPRGSYYTNTANGAFYVKIASGTGTDKWSQLATQTYVQDYASSGSSWREPVAIADTTSTSTTDIKTDLDADDLIQGVAVTVGMRILGTNVTGNKNVFIVGGVSGNWTLTEDTNLETNGDTVYVYSGTDAGKTYQYNGTNWVWINSADATEDGYIRTFIGKSGAGNEVPGYSSTNIITNGDSLETAIGKLDAEDGYQNTFIGKVAGVDLPAYTTNNFVANNDSLETAIGKLDTEIGANVSNGTVILAANKVNANITALDTEMGSINTYLGKIVGDGTPSYSSTEFITDATAVNVAISDLDAALADVALQVIANGITTITTIDTITGGKVAEWDVRVELASDSTRAYAVKVYALSNGVTVDYTRFAVLRIGTAIPGLAVTADFDSGDIRLRVEATSSVNVVSRRLASIM